MKKNLLSKYNKKGSLLVISGYPKREEIYSSGVCAVSSFTKNTLLALGKEASERKIIVLTMEVDRKEIYEENGILVIRCFKRNNPLTYLSLLKYILRFYRVRNVLLEFEFASFGNTLTTSLLAPLIWLLKLFGKNIYIVAHQVVTDIKSLSGHIGVSPEGLTIRFLNVCFKLFYILITLPAKKVIVLEEEFKKRLSRLTDGQKIVVIPHGVDTNIQSLSKNKAKKLMGIKNDEFTILYFGYLGWYKGVDFLIRSLGNTKEIDGRKIKLVIAGGPSFTQKDKPHYQKFLKKLDEIIKKANNITVTGFIEEDKIATVFGVSDLVVFPYRTLMSSSGPMSLAISHKKPFIVSENMRPLLNTFDIQEALLDLNLSDEIVFKLTKKSLLKTLRASMDQANSAKMEEFSKRLNQKRSFEVLARKYGEIMWPNYAKQELKYYSTLLKKIPQLIGY